jgi:hypothetical protein
MGQIDLARIKKDRSGWMIEIAEVKSSHTGVEGMARSQRRRLLDAQTFLCQLFGHRSRLINLVALVPD